VAGFVQVLDEAPSADRQTTHDRELDPLRDKAAKQLVKCSLAQLLRAAPAIRDSLWLSAMPSARFSVIGRFASARMRWTLTASALAAPVEALFFWPVIDAMVPAA
jgi:hypothetical protein